MKRIIGVLYLTLVAFTCLPTSLLATESAPAALNPQRQRGEMVVIGGKNRPDLIQAFDSLKATTVMTKGKVHAKTPDTQEEHALANAANLSKVVAQSNLAKSERASTTKSQNQGKSCLPVCPVHGTVYCTQTSCALCGGTIGCSGNHTCR